MSEKITTRLVGLFRSSGVLFSSSLFNRGLGFIAHILIIRALSPEAFGPIALIYSLGMGIGTLAGIGLPEGATRLISASETESQRGQFVAVTAAISLVVGGVVGLIIALAGPLLGVLFNPTVGNLSYYLGAYVFIFIQLQICIAILRGYEYSTPVAYTRDLLPYFLTLPFLIVGLDLFPESAIVIVLIYWLALQLTKLLLGLFYIRYKPINVSSPTANKAVEILKFSWPLALSAAFLNIMSNLDIVMIGIYRQQAEVGLYRGVYPLSSIVFIGLSSIVFMYLPVATEYFEHGDMDSLHQLYQVTTKWVSVLTFPLVVVFCLFPVGVIRGLLDPEYASGSLIFILLTLTVYSRVLVGPNAATIKAVDQPRLDFISAGVGVGVNVILNFVLVPKFGAPGAAIATLISYLAYNGTEVAFLYKMQRIHPFSINTTKSLIPTVIAGLAIHEAFGSEHSLPVLIGFGLVLIMVQVSAVVATRSLTDMDRDIYKHMKRRIISKVGR